MKRKVVIVGGGIAGMSAAIRLAAEGQCGDHLGERGKTWWKLNQRMGKDSPLTLVHRFLTMPWVLEKVFAQADRDVHDYIEIDRVDPAEDILLKMGKVSICQRDLPTLLAEIKKQSPDDAEQLFNTSLLWQ